MATIIGTSQSDHLVGTIDNDTITGFAGHDVSTGGDGGDRFIYQRLSDLSVWTGSVLPWHETITDLGEHGNVIEPDEQDVLDFSSLVDFLFVGDAGFSETGRNEYRFERFGEGVLILFDKGGDGIADRYLVLDSVGGTSPFDDPDEHPIFTNLLHPHDFLVHYAVGTAANETRLVGTDGNDRMYGLDGNDHLIGRAGDDEMFGGVGNDRLNGGEGIDTLIGGPGNDAYFVQSSEHEEIFEEPNGGIDYVTSTGFFSPTPNNVENLTLVGDAYEGQGNALSNIITGSSTSNRLSGFSGNDTILGDVGPFGGTGGGDSIRGGTGHDWIRGGTGADYIFGNSGADKFVYFSVADAGIASARTGDFIMDFESFNSGATERDRIDLHRIDANTVTASDDAFHFIGNGEFTGTAGELRFGVEFVEVVDPDPFFPDESFLANVRVVEGDVDGNGLADFQIGVFQPQFSQLSAADFFL